jgi:phage-related protein
MVNVTLSLIGSNGDTIELADDGDFILTTGVSGFGIPSTSVRIEPSAGNGGVWRSSKRGVRDIDLPIMVLGTDRADVETKLRRLARLLQDSNGPTRVQANYSDGTSVYLDAHYTAGAETQFGTDAGNTYCRWAITLQAPQPFWQRTTSESFNVVAVTGRGLLPQLSKLKVSSSQALGSITANNVGDVDTYPTWVIRGPIEGLTVTSGSSSFSYVAAIADGVTITIDTEAGTVVDDAGTNMYGSLGTAPKLFALPPGTTAMEVAGTGATTATKVTCYYSPRFEVMH